MRAARPLPGEIPAGELASDRPKGRGQSPPARALGRGARPHEAALVEAPRPDHPLEGWFAPALVERLAAVGVMTFDQLLGLIRRWRQRWYTAVPRLGAFGAERIARSSTSTPTRSATSRRLL
ncbi:phage integrase family protein [Burkholderia gladioli]|uniref:phage integrase family protein n=1 Tax=Burkholderia gladioli TaxID=28095 RepID=UPI001F27F7EA|nr:phage integrase family protein [Burkholderia gladioli]